MKYLTQFPLKVEKVILKKTSELTKKYGTAVSF